MFPANEELEPASPGFVMSRSGCLGLAHSRSSKSVA